MTAISGQDYSLLMRQGSQFVNQCFGANSSSDEMQIAQAGVNFAFSIGEMLAMGCQDGRKAKEEVSKETKAASTVTDAQNNSHDITMSKSLQQIMPQIEANIARVQEQLAKIEEQQQEKQDHEDSLKQIQNDIHGYLEIVNDSTKSFEKRNAALEKLGESNTQLTELGEQVAACAQNIEETGAEVTEITDDTQSLEQEGNAVVEQGVQEQNALLQQNGVQQAQAVATGVQGGADVTIGATAQATGSAMESNVTTASTGQKLITNGTDKEEAGTTRITGAATVNATLIKNAGAITTNLTEFSTIPTAIGSVASEGMNVGQVVLESINMLSPIVMMASENISDGSSEFQENIDNGREALEAIAQHEVPVDSVNPENGEGEGNNNNDEDPIIDEKIIEELGNAFAA